MPPTIDIDAVKLLESKGYLWDDWRYGFRRKRRIGRESTEEYRNAAPAVVAFEDLEDRHLVWASDLARAAGSENTVRQRHAGLKWLAEEIDRLET
jgi:hypothetical protein